MKVRSMTGFAQVKGQFDELSFTLSLKSVNHRFLDVHMRMPAGVDALEMKLRRALKEKLARGHVDLTLSISSASPGGLAINRKLVSDYVDACRALAEEFDLRSEPDLNAIFRIPGAMEEGESLLGTSETEAFDVLVLSMLDEVIQQLNDMRAEEGRCIDLELRECLQRLQQATNAVGDYRSAVQRGYMEKIAARMKELAVHADPDRILQEAALLAERSDIQEEIVRLRTHIAHFQGLLDKGGEIGKKLDFLLQEMNREANTLLSKTSGVAGEALRITELGLAMKSEIEKAREQVQNIE
jgi:uncharacterized protein (TIGR00255 family)